MTDVERAAAAIAALRAIAERQTAALSTSRPKRRDAIRETYKIALDTLALLDG